MALHRSATLCRLTIMAHEPRLSGQSLKVLHALLEAHGGELAGSEIGKGTSLQSGTLYPILMRLEECGWLGSRWEEGDPKTLGRPRRRYYRLTGIGATRARAALRELQPLNGRIAWA